MSASLAAGSGRTVAARLTALVGGDLVSRVFRFAAMIVLARSMTLEEFGAFNTAVAVVGVVLIVSTLGLTDLGTRDIAVDRPAGPQIAGRIVVIRLGALAATATVLAIALVILEAAPPGLVFAGLAMALSMTLAGDWILRGLEKMAALGVAWALGGAAVLAGALVVAAYDGSATSALWAYAVGEAAITATGWIALRKHIRVRPEQRQLAPLLRRTWPLAVASLVIYLYTANLDTIIIAWTRSTAEAGLYSAPYRVFWVLSAVTVFASYAALPALSRRSASGDEDSIRAAVLLLSRVLVCYSAVVVGVSELIGADLLGTMFGVQFESMGDEFTMLCVAVTWYAIGFPAGQSLIASDRSRGFMLGAAIAGSVNIVANLALVPPLGAMGAAIATAGSFAMGSLVWLRTRGVFIRAATRLLAPALAVSAIAIVSVSYSDTSAAAGVLTLTGAGAVAVSSWRTIRSAW